jgi:UDP-N-acetylglucosamine 3-dehydrogenase
VSTKRFARGLLGDKAMLLWQDGNGRRGCLKCKAREGENSMDMLRVAVIGCGRRWKTPGATGFGMAHQHMEGYRRAVNVKLVAMADIKLENAREFAREHEPSAGVYADYLEMLRVEKPDMVSVCTWPGLHCEMVVAAAEAGARAIHCEKPMAPTFGEAKRMHQVCLERKIQLTFDHQRRFNAPFRVAKEMLKGGAIGHLLRMEAQCPNLFDWGTHWFDMLFFFNDQQGVEWVIGQVEKRGDHEVFGVHIEGQAISHFKFKNDVHATMITGHRRDNSAQIRLIGTEGAIEIAVKDGPMLRVWSKGESDWREVSTSDDINGHEAYPLAVLDAIDALRNGREPELSGARALQATELIFATYESSRRRGRVDLPLEAEDSAYLAMLG